jgi:hypothetical protein
MRRAITTALTMVALVFAAKSAQSCGSNHIATTGTGSADMGCVFNVDVSADTIFRDSFESNVYNGEQGLVNDIGGALSNIGASGGAVNFQTVDGTVSFTVPAGAQEVTITLTNDGDMSGWHGVSADQGWTAGAQASATFILENGQWVPQSTAPGLDPCSAPQAPPAAPTTAAPTATPGVDPMETAAAVDAQLQAKLPLGSHGGDNEGLRVLRVE